MPFYDKEEEVLPPPFIIHTPAIAKKKMKNELPFRPVVLIVMVFLAIPFAGCSQSVPTGTVSGKVTMGNAPLTLGKIIFVNQAKGVGGGATLDAEGHYAVSEKIPVGEYKVYFVDAMKPGSDDPSILVPTPVKEKYKAADTSGLTFEIKNDENIADFNLEQ